LLSGGHWKSQKYQHNLVDFVNGVISVDFRNIVPARLTAVDLNKVLPDLLAKQAQSVCSIQ
jgi:hypothetical protein